jgi:sugar (pentulose or hexulose) kinase
MDPDATWQELCTALRQLKERPDDPELRAEVVSCLAALLTWIRNGGYAPTVEE